MLEYYQRPQFAPFTLEHPEPNPERLGVMLVHGFTGTPMDMRPLAEELFNLGADCHVIGLPGHGTDIANLQTMTEAKWRHAVQAAWMAHVRRYARRMLVGYSMGGAAALQMAATIRSRPPDSAGPIRAYQRSSCTLAACCRKIDERGQAPGEPGFR